MHDHSHPHPHSHAHAHDRGPFAFFHYLKFFPELWQSEMNRAVVELMEPRAGEQVVDLGAGIGAATVLAARSGATVHAVDPTPFMRRFLRLRTGWRSNVRVVDGAAESMPLSAASVDALWTVNTIHHWTDRPAAARELARVLRRGARVVLVDEDFDDPAHPEHREHRASVFDAVDPMAIAESLRAAGFATAEGAKTMLAGRPAKTVRAVR
jgi:ubiquinone/menaquinone biosynthesis C-methylase UbiE